MKLVAGLMKNYAMMLMLFLSKCSESIPLQQKKETRALREFEETLLHNYKLYLQYLELMLKGAIFIH